MYKFFLLVQLLCGLTAAQTNSLGSDNLNSSTPGLFNASSSSTDVTPDSIICFTMMYKCLSGQCIPRLWLCDGDKDCSGGEDESAIYCIGTCEPGRTKCTEDGSCIRLKYICDGISDCINGSDESNCSCPPLHYRCKGGQCIPESWLCDGDVDCEVQRDDEDIKHCNGTCVQGRTRCTENDYCIRSTKVCDGVSNCVNGSDEMKCDCPEGQYRCIGGGCILDSWLCDGDRDCEPWGDDEMYAHCNGTCVHGRTRCTENNYCIHDSRVCDGTNDCLHGSDEENCPSFSPEIPSTLPMQSYDCKQDEFQCISGRCLPGIHLCDGHRDCELGEDETHVNCKDKRSENNVLT